MKPVFPALGTGREAERNPSLVCQFNGPARLPLKTMNRKMRDDQRWRVNEKTAEDSPFPQGRGQGCPAIELSSAAGPHWQALNLNRNRNLARLRFLEIKSKLTIKIGKKPFRLNSMAVGQG